MINLDYYETLVSNNVADWIIFHGHLLGLLLFTEIDYHPSE